MIETMCAVSVWRGFGVNSRCGRKAKGELKSGVPACGVHLRAERTREQNDAKWEAQRQVARDALDDAQHCVDGFVQLGFEARASSHGTGQVVLPVAAAERVLERLRDR